MLLTLVSLSACHEHTWLDATCTEAKTCSSCDAVSGVALGHKWQDATCTEARTCTVCGVVLGDAVGHNWSDATCTEPKTCATCGATEGDAAGHRWNEANCTTPRTCYICKITEGSEKGHDWNVINAYLKKCKHCGVTETDQSKFPKDLGSLTPCTGKNYYKKYYEHDIYGNGFSEGLYIQIYDKLTAETEYVLNKEYKKFTTTLMISSDSYEYFKGSLKIYVDEVLAYDSGMMNLKTQPRNIEIDVSDALFLKIVVSGNSPYAKSGYAMLAYPMLIY